MDNWNQTQAPYAADAVVLHNGEVYRKLNDNDQTAPDAIGGGWELLQNTNLTEYQAIADSFSSYEQRVRDHKAKVLAAKKSAEAKLKALGLTDEELAALGVAS